MADLAAAIKQAEEALAVWHDRHSPLDPLSLAFALRSLLSAAREAEARAAMQPAPAPLAEVVEEGRRLLSDATRHTDGDLRCGRGALRILPHLLAVAAAAVEMRKFFGTNDGCTCDGCSAVAAFDAAARGEK